VADIRARKIMCACDLVRLIEESKHIFCSSLSVSKQICVKPERDDICHVISELNEDSNPLHVLIAASERKCLNARENTLHDMPTQVVAVIAIRLIYVMENVSNIFCAFLVNESCDVTGQMIINMTQPTPLLQLLTLT